MKRTISPIDLVYPLPVVLVTCSDKQGKSNIITIAWTTNISRKPVCLGIAIGKTKYSANLINETREFAVNIPSQKILSGIEQCGFTHGSDTDKFALTKFTQRDADFINVKLIEECPINIECKVINIIDIGSSFFFVGEVLTVHVDEDIAINGNEVDFKKLEPVLFTQKKYYSIGELLGQRGFLQNQ